MTKEKIKTQTKIIPRRMLVVYGFDENRKPRAAQFLKETEFDLARKAADLMGLSTYETVDANAIRHCVDGSTALVAMVTRATRLEENGTL